MSYMVHHAIIVTSWDKPRLSKMHEYACRLFPAVSDILASIITGYQSFFIPTDGSKDGWKEDDDLYRLEADHNRREFIKLLKAEEYDDDHSSVLHWAEVQYGDDNMQTLVLQSSDHRKRDALRMKR